MAETIVDDPELRRAVEALLFITDRPLSLKELCVLTQVKDAARIEALVGDIRRDLEERGSPLQVMEVAEGFQLATRAHYAPFVRRLFTDRMTLRLSAASLETLAIIAYKQPITRAEVEAVRGVEVIASLETLMEKGLAQVVGRKETVGRPLMYGTTPEFMRLFGLKNLEDLPPLEQFAAAAEAAIRAKPDGASAAAAESGVPVSPDGTTVKAVPSEVSESVSETPSDSEASTAASELSSEQGTAEDAPQTDSEPAEASIPDETPENVELTETASAGQAESPAGDDPAGDSA